MQEARAPHQSPDQRSRSGALLVGTSGWAYRGWTQFYPAGLGAKDALAFYSRHFPTVEVNTSFYHLPLATTYEKWERETGPGFLFALKLSRYITHIKKLSGVKVATRRFLERAVRLGPKLGPILVQLPPSWKADPKRLTRFLDAAASVADGLGIGGLRLAFEFRHETWFQSDEAVAALAAHGAAIVFGQSSRYPYPAAEPRTAPWIYLRFHGPRELFASKYGREDLGPWAGKIAVWLAEGSDVYAYFNNDVHGYAVEDARMLPVLVAKRNKETARPRRSARARPN